MTNYAVQVFGPGAGATVAVSGSASAATDVGAGTSRVALISTTDMHIRFGIAGVTSATSDLLIPAKTLVIFDIVNANHFFSAIQDSAAGTITWAAVQ